MVQCAPNARKRCRACDHYKPLEQFRRKSANPDGRQDYCKPCANAKLDAWRARTRDRRLAYNRDYYASEKGREVVRKYQAKKPAKKVAQLALNRAIKAGVMVRPPTCEECSARRPEGHHDDYAKPLDVRWLCRNHHKAWHRQHGEAKSADLPVSLNMGIRAAQLRRKAARRNLIPVMLAGGMTRKGIAKALGVSYWTIWTEARQCAAG